MVDAKTEGWIEIAQRGFENWKAKPHNARWFRKIDGTPIPNDLTICIGEAFAEPLRSLSLRVEAEKRAREEAERERDRLRDVIERDRTKTAEIIGGIRAVVGRWSWLGEGRGSYAWDDDRYQDEFRQMLDALKEATDPLRALAADWTDCPQDYQAARIDWKARAEAAETSLASARAEGWKAGIEAAAKVVLNHYIGPATSRAANYREANVTRPVLATAILALEEPRHE